MTPTPIDQFRADLRARLEADGRSYYSLARQCCVTVSALYRFLTLGKGIHGDAVLKLLPYVWPLGYPVMQREDP
jgi:lambda repressor-like predicted transcriptional regulator